MHPKDNNLLIYCPAGSEITHEAPNDKLSSTPFIKYLYSWSVLGIKGTVTS